MPDFSIRVAPQVILGPDVVNRLSLLSDQWAERCLLVADPLLHESKTIQRVMDILEPRGIKCILFDEIPEYAGSSTADEILNLARGGKPQAVIGLGGVRALSLARTAAMAARETGDLDGMIDGRPLKTEGLPFIAIPTAYRDPFLLTDSIILSDSRDRTPKLVHAQDGLTRLVLIDPGLTNSLSPLASALICMDLILQAVEGYVSQKATFFSDTLFEKALGHAFQALDGFISRPDDPGNRLRATEASLLAAFGLAASSAGIGTALSLSFNARYRVHKSSLSSIFLPYVLEGAAKSRPEKIAKVAALSGEEVSGLSSTDASNKAVDGIRQRLGALKVPTRLKDFDMELDSLVELASLARDLEMCAYLPRSMAVEDVYDLVKQAF